MATIKLGKLDDDRFKKPHHHPPHHTHPPPYPPSLSCGKLDDDDRYVGTLCHSYFAGREAAA